MSEAGAILQEVVLPEGARSVASGLIRSQMLAKITDAA